MGCRLSIPTKTLPFRLHLSDAVSLDLPSDAGASSLARHPYLSNLLLNEAHPSDTAILKPVGRRREPPGQTALPFQTYCSTRLTRPTRRFWNQSDVGESLRDRQLSFSILRPARPTQPRCRLTARPSDPLNFAFLSKPIRLGEPASGMSAKHPDQNFTFPSSPVRRSESWSPIGRRCELPGQASLPFLVPRWRRLPVQHSGYCAPVGRRREPHSETTCRFPLGRRD